VDRPGRLAGLRVQVPSPRPLDRLGPGPRFDHLHLICNNTHFLIPGAFPNLASHALAAMTRRLGDDWRDAHGHGLPVAEAFVDPSRFSGSMYTGRPAGICSA